MIARRSLRRPVCLALLSASILPGSFGCSKSPAKAEHRVQTSAPARRELLQVGSTAPLFSTTAHDGTPVELEKLRGKVVVLYFYPKDGTPGCTTEAEGFASEHDAIAEAGAVILGVSTDDNDSHRKFATDHGLPFLLLPDTDRTLADAYGVGGMLGMTARVTYLIDRQGKIAKIYPNVHPKDHAAEVLDEIARLSK